MADIELGNGTSGQTIVSDGAGGASWLTRTTAHIAESSNKRYITDAQQAILDDTSGTNTGDQDLSAYATKVGAEILTNKIVALGSNTVSGTIAQFNAACTNADFATDAMAKEETLIFALSDEATALTTGTAKLTFRMPFAMTVSSVRASVNTAPTGSTLIVDINEGGTTILSTKLSIDATEKTSTTAASAAEISDSALADDAEISFDIDQIGSTIAGAGLKVTIKGTRA